MDSERRSLSSRTKGNPEGRTADNETLDGFSRASATGSGVEWKGLMGGNDEQRPQGSCCSPVESGRQDVLLAADAVAAAADDGVVGLRSTGR